MDGEMAQKTRALSEVLSATMTWVTSQKPVRPVRASLLLANSIEESRRTELVDALASGEGANRLSR